MCLPVHGLARVAAAMPSARIGLEGEAPQLNPSGDEDEDKMNLHGLSRRSSAFDAAVPVDVLSAALYDRFRSYEEHTFAQNVLSPTRQGFGGHNEAKSHGSNRMVDKA
jgi:6-phosphogluconate dehydrogenase (decarboxylating)